MGTTALQVQTSTPALALARVLGEVIRLLEGMSDIDYAARPGAQVSGSIGAHVRHCVDHVQAVIDRRDDGSISFDERRRGTPIEHDRGMGLAALRTCVERLEAMTMDAAEAPIALDVCLDRAGASVRVRSSLGRELVYVLQHTIHHNAVIALLLASRGGRVPAPFGYAPSTPVRADEPGAGECAR